MRYIALLYGEPDAGPAPRAQGLLTGLARPLAMEGPDSAGAIEPGT